MTKWICTVCLLLLSILTFSVALDDQGESVGDGLQYFVVGLAIIIAIVAMIFWIKEFKQKKSLTAFLFCLLPFALAGTNIFFYYSTQQKINRAYFLLAINPDEASHQFKYYFRVDSTLKTHGLFFWSEGNDFQKFKMIGDTIFLDTILDATGIQSKIYLKTNKLNAENKMEKLLIPLDDHRNPVDSLTKFIVEEENNNK